MLKFSFLYLKASYAQTYKKYYNQKSDSAIKGVNNWLKDIKWKEIFDMWIQKKSDSQRWLFKVYR